MSEAYEEILQGEALMRPPPGARHEEICRRLHERVAASMAGVMAAKLLPMRSEVSLGHDTKVRPDLSLVTLANNKIFLVVEVVSSGDHHADTVIKKTLYEDHNVPRLWMVDPRYDNVEIYHGSEFGLTLREILAVRDTLSEPLIPQFQYVISDLFKT